MKKIIDISEWNGDINFERVKADGVDGVIIRMGYGKDHPDGWGVANLQKAIAAEIELIGVYWFSYAVTPEEAAKEAEYCYNRVAAFMDYINLPIFFDFEEDSIRFMKEAGVIPDVARITNIFKSFCGKIEEYGVKAGYYSNYYNLDRYILPEELKSFELWFAWWDSDPIPEDIPKPFIHQYTDKGAVAGISGSVDLNNLYSILNNNNSEVNNLYPEYEYNTIGDILKGIWRGDFGNGEERKEKLYNFFQDKINRGEGKE